MQYFEQVHRGIRAPGRALVPAICAVALCTAALMVAAWPTTAEAKGYKLIVQNLITSQETIKIRRIDFQFTDSTWTKVYVGHEKRDFLGRFNRTIGMGGYGYNRFKVKWKCEGADAYNTFRTSETLKDTTLLEIWGCTNAKYKQEHAMTAP